MYFNKITGRINNIKWDKVGMNASTEDGDLGYEFLRRLAYFFNENNIKPMKPFMANIAKLLGDNDEILLEDCCTEIATETLSKHLNNRRIFQYYIQLSRYVDKYINFEKYLSVYEPLVRIYERGGLFILRLNELEVIKSGTYPLNGWYERFYKKPPIDIGNLNFAQETL